MTSKKKVLIITYYWPPSGGSGVQRWMYFAKYLKEFGHEIIVLTVDPKSASYSQIDMSLLSQVEGIETFTVKTMELTKLYSRITSKSSQKGIPQGSIEGKNSLFKKIARFIRGNFFIPDSRVGWVKYAIKMGQQIIKEKSPDLIITTGPPHSTHLIGYQLKKTNSIKWIADFRDPWIEIHYNNLFYRTKWAKRKDERLEKKVIELADKVLTIGKNLCELLKTKNIDSSKFHYIYNGFDSVLFDDIKPVKSEYFDIVFTGLLSNNQNITGLLNSLKFLEKNIEIGQVRFLLAGKIDSDILSQFKTGLQKINVIDLGYLAHDKAIEAMLSSSVLVTVLPTFGNLEIMISGKIMEYIAAKKPVLLFGSHRSEAAALLEQIPHSHISPENEYAKASIFLEEQFQLWPDNASLNETDSNFEYSRYSRKNTAKELSDLISKLID
jgi:hypothetical protein